MLIRPSTIPCQDKIIQWSTLLSINGPNPVTLVDPFDFESIDEYNRVRTKVHYDQWKALTAACRIFGILPPTTGTKPNHIIPGIRHSLPRRSKKAKISA